MSLFNKSLSALILSLSTFCAAAAPAYLVTHNNTNEESNAYISGIGSNHPTQPHSTGQVSWRLVNFACWGHTTNNKCAAEVRMATNTRSPITIGTMQVDLISGDITPKTLSANGYTITVVGLGETTITKN